MRKYKFLEHTADIKFQAFGNSLEEAFISSFDALKEIIVEKNRIKSVKKIKLKVKGNDLKELLYNFLEEVLFLLDAKDFIASEIKNIKIDVKKNLFEADVLGDRVSNYKISNDVKAITYNDMSIKEEKGKFIVQVVVDV
ncbi:archease [Candidatus Pacearchaeota archaeon]|nr:archease [Candidatus Pacearchaeota archaeon]